VKFIRFRFKGTPFPTFPHGGRRRRNKLFPLGGNKKGGKKI
jgi:hypothetical protein